MSEMILVDSASLLAVIDFRAFAYRACRAGVNFSAPAVPAPAVPAPAVPVLTFQHVPSQGLPPARVAVRGPSRYAWLSSPCTETASLTRRSSCSCV